MKISPDEKERRKQNRKLIKKTFVSEMRNKAKDKWKWGLVFLILIVAYMFLYISRQDGILFLLLGSILYVIALFIINRINRSTKD